MRVLTLGGLAGPILFAAVVATAAALRPDYHHATHFISELGATGTPNAAFMNYAGFVAAGLLMMAFGAGLKQCLPSRGLAVVGAGLVMVFGGGMVASGIVSCDPGCPQTGGSMTNSVHDAIAPVTFLSMIVAVVLVGRVAGGASGGRPFFVYSIVTAALAIVFLLALVVSREARVLTGLWQRLLVGALFVWCGVTAFAARSSRLGVLLCTVALMSTAACRPVAGDFDALAAEHLPQIDGTVAVSGLQADVDVIRDRWGVPHIYAANLDDLFFAQGFIQAQDRLWQMDMYRRAAEGRLAEILGPDAVEHDRLARLLKYRGPWTEAEFASYHPEGRRILTAFTAGINAYIAHAESAGELPVEYTLTGLRPEPWAPESPLLRVATAMPTGDARSELRLAQDVARFGAAEANRRARPLPYRDLLVPPGTDYSLIDDDVLDGLSGFRGTIVRPPLVGPYDAWARASPSENTGALETSPGSNNWAISGSLTASGRVIVANDPHRSVTNPSLRYVVHLDAPGWTAIGSTEPVLPGVAIGHNGRVAWGLTIVGTDQADVYVEEVNPANPNEVRFNGAWEPLRIERETIVVKGGATQTVALKFSRHGPIFHEDASNHRAYALRSTMHEPGSTGYLGGLRLNVVDDCAEFLEALDYWFAPTENMVCGDADGNIAWQATALSPRRDGWHGRLPVPGTGAFEWLGFRDDLPREWNPARGWIATANHDIHPPGYDPPLYFKTDGDFARIERLEAVLAAGRGFTVEDSQALQHDAYSAASAAALQAFRGWTASDPEVERHRQELAAWDGVYRRESRAAAIFRHVQRAQAGAGRGRQAGPRPASPASEPEAILALALDRLRDEQGHDPAGWRWGRSNRSEFPHALVSAYDLPSAERTGGAGTVAAIGATFREIIDFANLDGSLATNAPGQSGRPGSPFYGNLIDSWASGEYFPLSFSRAAVEANAAHRLRLQPRR